jgi:hypothetical protein
MSHQFFFIQHICFCSIANNSPLNTEFFIFATFFCHYIIFFEASYCDSWCLNVCITCRQANSRFNYLRSGKEEVSSWWSYCLISQRWVYYITSNTPMIIIMALNWRVITTPLIVIIGCIISRNSSIKLYMVIQSTVTPVPAHAGMKKLASIQDCIVC